MSYLAEEEEADGKGEPDLSINPLADLFQQAALRGSFQREQQEDERLKCCWAQVREIEGKPHCPTPLPATYFSISNGLLYHITQGGEEDVRCLVVPLGKMLTVLELAHSHPLGSYLGIHNTLAQIQPRFFGPGMRAAVERLCRPAPSAKRPLPKSHRNPLSSCCR